jgi:hypothetical protein
VRSRVPYLQAVADRHEQVGIIVALSTLAVITAIIVGVTALAIRPTKTYFVPGAPASGHATVQWKQP